MQLSNSSQQLATSLNDLRSALDKAKEVCGGYSGEAFNSATQLIRSLKAELDAFYKAAMRNELHPLPGETVRIQNEKKSCNSLLNCNELQLYRVDEN